MKQSNSACILLTVLVLVLAGREVQRTFFGDSDELAQDFTADELASFLSINRGMWELPEITDENTLVLGTVIDGVDQPHSAMRVDLQDGRLGKEVPFFYRYYLSGEKTYMKFGTMGSSITWGFNIGGRDYGYRGCSTNHYPGPDGIFATYDVVDGVGTPHEVAFRFQFIKDDI
jgi:hypothetical protein